MAGVSLAGVSGVVVELPPIDALTPTEPTGEVPVCLVTVVQTTVRVIAALATTELKPDHMQTPVAIVLLVCPMA